MEISIILPIHNSENDIEECISSVLAQSMIDFELIAVDDGSTDGSPTLLDRIARKDNRIKVIHQKNAGVSAARNVGIELAQGNYITFIDSDDRYKPDYLQKLHDLAVAKNADVVCCGFENTKGTVLSSVSYKEFADKNQLLQDYQELLDSRYLNIPWNKMYKREKIITRFPLNISLGEDLIFNLKVLQNCKNIVVIPDSLYVYKQDIQGLTGKFHLNGVEAACKVSDAVRNFAGSLWCQEHEEYLLFLFYTDYMRCIKKLAITKDVSRAGKKDIFVTWNRSEHINKLIKKQSLITRKLKISDRILIRINKWFLYSAVYSAQTRMHRAV